MNILIVGAGSIGRGLESLIRSQHTDWDITFFLSRDFRSHFKEMAIQSDIVCIAISTKDNGTIARDYIREALQCGKPVVTCEKGALSEHFETLMPYLDRVGYSATVGGGSGILNLLHNRLSVSRIMGIVNGTLNYICWSIEKGLSLAKAVEQAQNQKLVEPGIALLSDIVNAELRDARRKAVILYNLACKPCSLIKESDCSYYLYYDHGALQLFRQGKRLVINMFPRAEISRYRVYLIEPCFWINTASHYLTGTFVHADGLFPVLPKEAQNCLTVWDGKDTASAFGVGAGVNETASAILSDIKRLLNVG